MPTIMLLLQALHSANHLALPCVFSIVLKVTHLAHLMDRHHAHLHALHSARPHADKWHTTRSPLKAIERGVVKTPRLG
jgi:hypothetical protein